jgi:hypothetical protein
MPSYSWLFSQLDLAAYWFQCTCKLLIQQPPTSIARAATSHGKLLMHSKLLIYSNLQRVWCTQRLATIGVQPINHHRLMFFK